MKPSTRYIIVYILLGITALYLHLHNDLVVPASKPLAEFPRSIQSWQMSAESSFSANVLSVLKASDYFSRQYQDAAGNKVTIYLGYHSGGKDSGGIHSPKHCLPGSGWHELSTKRGTLALGNETMNIVRAVYQKGEQKELYLYWFQLKGKTLSDEYSLKIGEITNSLLYRRRDSAFIRISVPFEQNETKALELGEQFIKDTYPVIQTFLPR